MPTARSPPAPRATPPAATRGTVTTKDVVNDYVEKVLSFIDVSKIKPFNVVLDAGRKIAEGTPDQVIADPAVEILHRQCRLGRRHSTARPARIESPHG